MKTITNVLIAVLVLILISACGNSVLPQQEVSGGGSSSLSPDRLPKETLTALPDISALTGNYDIYQPKSEADLLADTNYGYVIVRTTDDFDPALFKASGAEVVSSIKMTQGKAWYVHKDSAVYDYLALLHRLPGVIYAQPDKKVYPSALPNDVQVQNGNQYSLPITAWNTADDNYGFGPNTPYVAVIDTGLNMAHEEFTGLVEYAKSAFQRQPDGSFSFIGDGNNFVDIPAGENWDDEAHGTHVTGTIAALGDNNKGVAGVCWRVKLISYKCFAEAAGSGSDWAVYGSLYDLTQWKIDNTITDTIPVNMSLGGAGAGFFELEVINAALAENIAIIAAMGNDGTRTAHYPAAYSGVIAVGATNGRDEKVHFSMPGSHISVSAPGYDIISTGNLSDDDYQWMSGTSMAAPFVTGLVAYMLTYEPTLSPSEIKSILEDTADDLGSGGWDEEYGYGRVNVNSAIGLVSGGGYTDYYDGGVITVSFTNIAGASPQPVQGATVYLYDGAASGNFVALGVTNADGEMEFRGLPGSAGWAIRISYQGDIIIADDIDNSAGAVAVDLEYDKVVYHIQTVPNAAYNGGGDQTDTILTVYDTGLNVLKDYDYDYLDTVDLALSPGTYYLQVTPYNARGGNYGVYITEAAAIGYIDEIDVVRAGTVDFAEPNDSSAEAYSIDLNTPYPLYLESDGEDWFSFVIP